MSVPSSELGGPQHLSSSECAPPPPPELKGGGGHTLLRVNGWVGGWGGGGGVLNSDVWKKPSTLSALCWRMMQKFEVSKMLDTWALRLSVAFLL